MVNVKQYIVGVAVAVSALLNPIESSAYEIKLVKSVYTPHDKSGMGCWYGMGVEDLDYKITFNSADIINFTKKREEFLTQLARDLDSEIWGSRCGPSLSNIVEGLKEDNPVLKKGKLTTTEPLTYKASRSVGFGLECSF